jgi:CheY-like chemotaxis protein
MFTILAVDDEPGNLTLLRRCLEPMDQVAIVTAEDGPAALHAMAVTETPAVVIADMHMPGMDGTTLLARVRELSPDTIRVLLTGHANVASAIDAVNVGQIFRFLTKPCHPDVLRAAVAAAIEQHKLITAERVLLEHTLQGTVKTLVDVLSLTNSVSFGRAMRIRRHVTDLAERLGRAERWQLEMAAMLSQLGYVTLPAEVAGKVYNGGTLSREEAEVVDRLPAITEQLLANIPRLEIVRAILAHYQKSPRVLALLTIGNGVGDQDRHLVIQGAQLLRLAADFDILEARGMSAAIASNTLRGRTGNYAREMLDALGALRAGAAGHELRELLLKDVEVGMVLADDLTTATGSLLVVRGYELTPSFVQRCHSYPPGWLKEPISVLVPIAPSGAS